jgi:hypothetical protein
MKSIVAAIAMVVGLLGSAASAAPVTTELGYSGYLQTASGQAVTSPTALVLKLYDQEAATNPLWSETVVVTPGPDGYFSTPVGAGTTPLSPAWMLQKLWLGIAVQSETEMTPRVKLQAVPYALTADWDNLTGKPSTFTPAVHTHDWAQVTGTIFAGSGSATTAARSDHAHAGMLTAVSSSAPLSGSGTSGSPITFDGSSYVLKTDLSTAGTFNASSNPVDWTKLKGVPTFAPASGSANYVQLASTAPTTPQVGSFYIDGSARSFTVRADGMITTPLYYGGDATTPLQILGASVSPGVQIGNKVGIAGAPNASYALYVTGNAYTTGTLTQASSRKLKKNIRPLENALDKTLQLRGVSYEYKDQPGETIGVIAEETDEVLPQVVSHNPETHEATGVNYSALVPVLIEAVKEQNKQIEALKAEVEALKRRP